MGWGSISIQFNGHFSRWIWVSRYQNVSILDLLRVKDDASGGDNRSYNMQSSSQIVTTNKPIQLFTDLMPFLSPNQQCQSIMPPPHRVEAFSNDACLTSICLSNVCLSRTLGLNREQSQWAGSLLSAARPLATCRGGGGGILWRPPAQLG